MPRFLRIITGDAKAFTNGDANANASWSCTGFENRQLKDKYPICPRGQSGGADVRLPELLGRANTDSANHRTHVAFARGRRALPVRTPHGCGGWRCRCSARPSSSGRRTVRTT
ncbi:hypothetical protein KMB31_05495 [Streptomyces sp. CYG21]|nr:hypothetical protein [Streptomyces sp. CYG21]